MHWQQSYGYEFCIVLQSGLPIKYMHYSWYNLCDAWFDHSDELRFENPVSYWTQLITTRAWALYLMQIYNSTSMLLKYIWKWIGYWLVWKEVLFYLYCHESWLYKSLVQRILESGNVIWGPYYVLDQCKNYVWSLMPRWSMLDLCHKEGTSLVTYHCTHSGLCWSNT